MGGEALNTEHLMAFVNEAKAEGNDAYKAGKLSDALNAWQRGLDAIGQVIEADCRLKVAVAQQDVEVVLRARSVLHSNRGQALMSKEFWRRAIVDLSEAIKVDRLNAKALWRRYRCHRALRHWAEAEADLDALLAPELQAAAAPLLAEAKMTADVLAETRAELQAQRREAERVAAETFDERVEQAAHTGIEQLRERFEQVIKRNGLRSDASLSEELAEMLTRPGGVTAAFVAAVYQIDEDDARVIMEWVKKACMMRDELGYEGAGALV